MHMKIHDCKTMMVDIIGGKNFKASEVSELVTSLHVHTCGTKSLPVVFKDINSSNKYYPITATDFEIFVEDVLKIVGVNENVNMSKYSYLPWLHYISTEYDKLERSNLLNTANPRLPKGFQVVPTSEEIHSLLRNVGLNDTILIYSVVLLLLGK